MMLRFVRNRCALLGGFLGVGLGIAVAPAHAGLKHHQKYKVVQGYVIQQSTAAAPVQVQLVSQAPAAAAAPVTQSSPQASPQATSPQAAPAKPTPQAAAPTAQAPAAQSPTAPQTIQFQLVAAPTAPQQTFQVVQMQAPTVQVLQASPVQAPVQLVSAPTQAAVTAAPSAIATPATVLVPHRCFNLFHK